MDTKTYTPTDGQRQVLLNLGNAVAQRKLALYELNMQLEVAQRERDLADARFGAALAAIAEPQGFVRYQLAADLSTITEAK